MKRLPLRARLADDEGSVQKSTIASTITLQLSDANPGAVTLGHG